MIQGISILCPKWNPIEKPDDHTSSIHYLQDPHNPKKFRINMDPLTLLREHEPELQKRFGVAKIDIFGSFARGEERKDSDVDVLVTFQQGKRHLIILWGQNSISKTSSCGRLISVPMLHSNHSFANLSCMTLSMCRLPHFSSISIEHHVGFSG